MVKAMCNEQLAIDNGELAAAAVQWITERDNKPMHSLM